MKLSGVLTLLFAVLLVCVIVLVQKRHYGPTKHTHDLHITSRKSKSKSPPPPYKNYEVGVYNVMSYGAVGDGVTDDTEAFSKTWDSACQADTKSGGTVFLVPNKYSFLIKPIIFKGPCKCSLVFQIDGSLMPPDGPKKWPEKASKQDWMLFKEINGMTMQGYGLINGRGEKWWDLPCKPHNKGAGGPCDSPSIIRFSKGSDLTVRGLRLENSPKVHIRFGNCQRVHVEKISINAPGDSPNTDGIHLENTNNVRIYDSLISTGDDCISIGNGCYNVDIRNMMCGPGHGISIGSLGKGNSQACVSNITVSDSVIKNSDNGVRIKTWQGGSGAVSGVTFKNIHMDTVRYPIIINQFYCLSKKCPNQTSALMIENIHYSNIRGTYDSKKPPINLACSDSMPCTNLTLREIDLVPAQGGTPTNPFCWKAFGMSRNTLLSTTPQFPCLLGGYPKKLHRDEDRSCSKY